MIDVTSEHFSQTHKIYLNQPKANSGKKKTVRLVQSSTRCIKKSRSVWTMRQLIWTDAQTSLGAILISLSQSFFFFVRNKGQNGQTNKPNKTECLLGSDIIYGDH